MSPKGGAATHLLSEGTPIIKEVFVRKNHACISYPRLLES